MCRVHCHLEPTLTYHKYKRERDREKQDKPNSQFLPKYPVAHWHSYLYCLSKHMAPFPQGIDSHSLMSTGSLVLINIESGIDNGI